MKKVVVLGLLILLVFLKSDGVANNGFCYLYLEFSSGSRDYELIDVANGVNNATIAAIDPAGIFISYDSKKINSNEIRHVYSQIHFIKKIYAATYSYSDDGEISWFLLEDQ